MAGWIETIKQWFRRSEVSLEEDAEGGRTAEHDAAGGLFSRH